MASLIKRHSKACAGFPGAVNKDGPKEPACTCQPMWYVAMHGGPGGRIKVGRDRRGAQQRLKLIEAEVTKGEYQPLKNIGFAEWSDEWFKTLNEAELRGSTMRGYVSTLNYARAAFGSKLVRNLTVSDIDTFLAGMSVVRHSRGCKGFSGQVYNDESAKAGCTCKPRALTMSTKAKHLRVLSACLKAAVKRHYAASNPINALSSRPRAKKNEAAYFENDELPKLFAELRDFDRPLFEAALKTGMRLGELLALTWGDVNLSEQTIRVIKSFTAGIGVTPPKTEAGRRTVDITNGAVTLFEDLVKGIGSPPPDDALVFPNTAGGYRSGTWIVDQLYAAMGRAGVPRVGATGKPRVFHSFRHTYAKVAMENGAQLPWLQRHLGHESLKITSDIYGHFGSAARKLEVAKLEEAFNV